MITVEKNHSLQLLNTFGIEAKSEYFVAVKTLADLQEALALNIRPVFILGGGSNILLTKDVAGLVIKNEIDGHEVEFFDGGSVVVSCGGGENWHQFVLWTLAQNFGGLENLSLIPGTVGAAPIQNIGAYGVELKDVFEKLEAIQLDTGETTMFSRDECAFGYRDSIFKKERKGKYLISRVWFRLTAKNHTLKLDYGDIRRTLLEMNIETPTIQDVSRAVIAIRRSKLPDPAELGNAGSFFKNPEIEQSQFDNLSKKYPAMPHFPLPNQMVKIPAGWLIEQCGWKGKIVGNTGSHARQALVLVNYGNATGAEIWRLANEIRQSVFEKFGVTIIPEVNVI